MQFSVLHIRCPEDSDDDPGSSVEFNTLAHFLMPRCRIIELHILDPRRRMIGVLFLCHDTGTIGLYIVFDWESGLTSILNTGLPFVRVTP